MKHFAIFVIRGLAGALRMDMQDYEGPRWQSYSQEKGSSGLANEENGAENASPVSSERTKKRKPSREQDEDLEREHQVRQSLSGL